MHTTLYARYATYLRSISIIRAVKATKGKESRAAQYEVASLLLVDSRMIPAHRARHSPPHRTLRYIALVGLMPNCLQNIPQTFQLNSTDRELE